MSATPSHPHLKQLLDENRAVQDAVKTVYDQFNHQQLRWKPDENTWSIVEVTRHLEMTMALYLPAVRAHLEMHRRSNQHSDAPFKPTWFGKKFIGYIVPENPRAVPTVRAFTPTESKLSIDSVYQEFNEQANGLNRLIIESDGYPLNGKKFSSPLTMLIRFTLGEGLWLQVAHNHRHQLQMQRVAGLPDFPLRGD